MFPRTYKTLVITPIVVIPIIGLSMWYVSANLQEPKFEVNNTIAQNNSGTRKPTITPIPSLQKPKVKQPGASYTLPLPVQTFQTFNNCGPATFSMMLAYFGISVSQQELGSKLRPWQNPQGINDDKSVTVAEIAEEAKNYNFIPYYRPNGDIEKLKLLLANELPVLTRTWLKENEDIGHYRVVRGYDDTTQEIIQNDSLQGANLRFPYDEFLRLWQGFNYEYLVLVPPEKKELVEAIIGVETDETVAWQNALARAQAEAKKEPNNPYPLFNQSVAYSNLGQHKNATDTFEQVVSQLPSRMLWYQIDPIISYQKLGNYDRVFSLSDAILNNQNRAFSELYIIRGDSYKAQGKIEQARAEFEKAVLYNKNLKEAQDALAS